MKFEECKTNKDWALAYRINLSWNVIPLIPSTKQPYIKWKEEYGLDERLCDLSEIEEWWNEWPDAGVGMITGELSGVTVFDCDCKEALKFMLKQGIDRTPIVQSSSKFKLHFYFDNGGRKFSGFVGKNRIRLVDNKIEIIRDKKEAGKGLELDVRSHNNIVVLPPTIHKKGMRYKWKISPMETPLAKMRLWQEQLLFQTRSKPKGINKTVMEKYDDPLVDYILENVRMSEILPYYGVNISKRDNLPCPIGHPSDNKSSFCWTERFAKCFSCCPQGHGWNVITLVRDIENIKYNKAVKKICEIMNINPMDDEFHKVVEAKIVRETKNGYLIKTEKGMCMIKKENLREITE